MREIDLSEESSSTIYKILVAAVQPRPIAWVSTVSLSGVVNLAPFSFFTVASREPATVVISVGRRADGEPKDTVANVRETGEFVVNVASDEHRAMVHLSGLDSDPDDDEFARTGAVPVPSSLVRPPRVAQSRLALECTAAGEVEVGTDVLLLGRVLAVHAAEGVLDETAHVDNTVLRPLGRLAGPWFTAPLGRVPAVDEVARV